MTAPNTALYARVVQLAHAGHAQTAIAAMLGITRQRVSQIMKAEGYVLVSEWRRRLPK